MKTRQACWVLAFCAFAATALLPRQAQARACAQASDCPMGYECEVAASDAGAASDGGPTGTCMSLPCQSNSDCGPGLSCFIEGWSLGAGLPLSTSTQSLFAAPDGGKGSACIPQWEVACTSASDCGPGFTCPPSGQDTGATLTGTLTSLGGAFNCGKDQDASEPPYATVTTVPCSAVPTPLSVLGDAAIPGGLQIPSICEAGTTCTEVSWNTCAAPQTTPCSVDSDCASTWTCGCETNCDGPVLAADGGCTMVCIAPNSDLFAGEVCSGGAEGSAGGLSFGPSGSTAAPSSPGASDSGVDAAGASGSPAAAGSSSGHGGCQVGSDSTNWSWALVSVGVLAAAGWRPRRRSRVTR
jgi:MYXO-CTERM domain-containing protein